MKSVNNSNRYLLLPPVFRKIGYSIIVVLAIAITAMRMIAPRLLSWNGPVIQLGESLLFILALVFVAWARDEKDDDLIIFYRLKAICIAFLACLLYFLIMPSLYVTGVYTGAQIRGIEPVLGMLLIYQLAFKIQKKKALK